ncbi:endonuclease [Lactobacillus phage Lbab1]|jgi:hypothetical protein|nr:endonuclease [Lactobacillus phage Lbab1]
MKTVYADSVKQLILDSPYLFTSKDDHTTVLFEKEIDGLSSKPTIADCLIFSHLRGLIGVEIKTAHDSKARLTRQLAGYSKVCDQVYVFIHDSKFTEVEDILEDFPHVGCICYTEIGDMLSPGIVKKALENPLKDSKVELDMLWSAELWDMCKLVSSIKHKKVVKYKVSNKRKRIKFILDNMGIDEGSELFIDFVIEGLLSPDRSFSCYNFRWKS